MASLSPDHLAFLAGGGELGAMTRAHDWASSPLGPPERWPQPLKTLVEVMLASDQAMFIAWGHERTTLYNDRYAEILAGKHPDALGRPFLDVWHEIRDDLLPIVEQAFAGEPVQMDDIELTMHRKGYPEETHFSFSYTPIRDESGRVAGFFCPCTEITPYVLAERRNRFFATLGELLRDADRPEQVTAIAAELLGERLGASVVGYAEVEDDGGHVTVRRDWVGPGGRSVVGRLRLRDFGPALVAELEAGQSVAVGDVLTDPLTAGIESAAAHAAIGCRAHLDVPILAGGRLAAILFVHSAEPRSWTDAEIRLAEDTAERTRAAVERGRAEAALRESEDHYRHAVELDPQTSWTSAPDGQLDRVNRRWFEWTGTTGLGSSYADGLHADDRQRTFDVWGRSVATGEPYDIEHRVKMRDGSYRWMHSRAHPRRDEGGRIVRWYGTTEDVHERRRVEEALREETRTLETLNRVGAALAGELDLERLVQMVTDAGVELTGAKFGAFFHNLPDETGEQLYLFTLSGAQRSDFEKLGRVRATGVFGPTFRNEGVVRSDDILADPRYGQFEPHRGMPAGHLPVRSYMGVPVVSRSGEVLGGLLFGHPEPGRFTDRHERLMVGVAAQAAVAIDNARLFQQVQQAKETLENRVAERTLALEQAHDALRQSQKMEAVGQLTGGIAHDFNNMLAVITGSLDLLGRRVVVEDPRARRYLDAAADGAKRAAQLTQRLLAFSRRQPLRPEPVDANKLLAGMSDLLRQSLGPDVQLEVDLAPDLWRTHADPNQLESAILNLAVNARDAMPGGGRLTICTSNVDADDGGDQVLIAVADTGAGMPPDVIAKAFDPFFTTKEVGKGTGLGLSQVYGFVRQSGGHVRIRSEPGQGATIEVSLPRYQGAEIEATAGGDAPGPATGDAGEMVLVVEDEPGVRQFSTDALGELGYRVLEANGAAAALRHLDAHPDIALLFTDVVMPEVNGAKLAEEARRRRPDLKVLFTTGYARDAVTSDGALDPAVELIGKPFTVEQLAAKVRDVLDAPVG